MTGETEPLVIARIEIELHIDPDGQQTIWCEATDPTTPDEPPPLVTLLGMLKLTEDTFLNGDDEPDEDAS